MERDRVVVIGAGLSGLAAALDLTRAGEPVLLVEAAPGPGGLASSVEIQGRAVERFYHFICTGDRELLDLVAELGLRPELHWRRTRASIYHGGRLHPFSGPLDLLRFPGMGLAEKVRFGLHVLGCRRRRDGGDLDRTTAREWVEEEVGPGAFAAVWGPLLRAKFGPDADRISAAWLWHRIHRVATSRPHALAGERFGYLERGSESLVAALAARLGAATGFELRTRTATERIVAERGRVTGVKLAGHPAPVPARAVISTVALPVLRRLAPDLDPAFSARLDAIDYTAVVCLLLKLKRPLGESFWINVDDPRIRFNGVIEYTRLNRHTGLAGALVYVPTYLPRSDRWFTLGDEELYREHLAGLGLVFPGFDASRVEEWHVSRAAHAQAVCTTGFADLVPAHATPLAGLFVTDSTQFYPEDRTLAAAIRVGRRAAALCLRDDRR